MSTTSAGVEVEHAANEEETLAEQATTVEEAEVEHALAAEEGVRSRKPKRRLPSHCPGCGARAQTELTEEAGYYDTDKKYIKEYLGLLEKQTPSSRFKHQQIQETLASLDLEALAAQGVDLAGLLPDDTPKGKPEPEKPEDAVEPPPVCMRCKGLNHHNTGRSIIHPGVDALRATIEQSPYKYNHIYHVVDAADFPMSLIPGLQRLLGTLPLRSHNRRSRAGGKWQHGRQIELSFIITRSDLLAPTKAQVDSLMPYLTETLRQGIGRIGKNVRLGNVTCVSASRSWWTHDLRERIFRRGGAGWFVGKVNVGKSRLFSEVFPKGRADWSPRLLPPLNYETATKAELAIREATMAEMNRSLLIHKKELPPTDHSLLPPARDEVNYPAMPIHSALPGTTAAPVRLPFGGGKGELIDLPGLSRGDLELLVQEEFRGDLVMKKRIIPENVTIKPGRSLLIGGFIRITPRNSELTYVSAAFTPIEAHLTSTPKAEAVQEQREDAPNVRNISIPGTGETIKKAGSYVLKYDITRARAGPLTDKKVAGLKVESLPFRVLGIDILIEGVGWVEIVCQVRVKNFPELAGSPEERRRLEALKAKTDKEKKELERRRMREEREAAEREKRERDSMDWDQFIEVYGQRRPNGEPEILQELKLDEEEPIEEEQDFEEEEEEGDEEEPVAKTKDKTDDPDYMAARGWPVVDVFSPHGKFIGARMPMNASLFIKKDNPKGGMRQRKPMKGAKKEMKKRARDGKRD